MLPAYPHTQNTVAAGRQGQDTASTVLAAMAGEGEESNLLGGAVDGHPIYVWTPEGKVSMQGDALRPLLALPALAAGDR